MATKVLMKHMQKNGIVATRETSRPYTHVIVGRIKNVAAEIARATSAEEVAELNRNAGLFTVVSWHVNANPSFDKILKRYLEMKVERINNGVAE